MLGAATLCMCISPCLHIPKRVRDTQTREIQTIPFRGTKACGRNSLGRLLSACFWQRNPHRLRVQGSICTSRIACDSKWLACDRLVELHADWKGWPVRVEVVGRATCLGRPCTNSNMKNKKRRVLDWKGKSRAKKITTSPATQPRSRNGARRS